MNVSSSIEFDMRITDDASVVRGRRHRNARQRDLPSVPVIDQPARCADRVIARIIIKSGIIVGVGGARPARGVSPRVQKRARVNVHALRQTRANTIITRTSKLI